MSVNDFAPKDSAAKAENAARDALEAEQRALSAEQEELRARSDADLARDEMQRMKWARDQYAGTSYKTKDGKTALGVEGLKAERERLKTELALLEKRAEDAKEQAELARTNTLEADARLTQRQHELDERELRIEEEVKTALEHERTALNEQRSAYETAYAKLDELQDGITIEDVVRATVDEIERTLNQPDSRTPLGNSYLSQAKRALREAFAQVRSWFEVETITGNTRLGNIAITIKERLIGQDVVDLAPIHIQRDYSKQYRRDNFEYM